MPTKAPYASLWILLIWSGAALATPIQPSMTASCIFGQTSQQSVPGSPLPPSVHCQSAGSLDPQFAWLPAYEEATAEHTPGAAPDTTEWILKTKATGSTAEGPNFGIDRNGGDAYAEIQDIIYPHAAGQTTFTLSITGLMYGDWNIAESYFGLQLAELYPTTLTPKYPNSGGQVDGFEIALTYDGQSPIARKGNGAFGEYQYTLQFHRRIESI